MKTPDTPASRSVVPAGDVAAIPDSTTIVKTTDLDNQQDGLLIKWEAAEWLWGDGGSFVSLEAAR